jgi:hypothetical protein
MLVMNLPFRIINGALTLNDYVPGLDGDLDPLGNFESLLRVAVVRLLAEVLAVRCFATCAIGLGRGASIEQFEGENCAVRRFGSRVPGANVHVLHLDGCCELVVLNGRS